MATTISSTSAPSPYRCPVCGCYEGPERPPPPPGLLPMLPKPPIDWIRFQSSYGHWVKSPIRLATVFEYVLAMEISRQLQTEKNE